MRVITTPTKSTGFGGKIGGCLTLIFGVVVGGVIASCAITIGIWPGEIKLLAPLFCTDAQPDAFVVADTYSPRPGETVTNFTMYCMGPRGDATDKGFLWPFLAISVFNGLVILVLFLGIGVLTGLAKARRGGGPDSGRTGVDVDGDGRPDVSRSTVGSTPLGPGSTAGPFVD